MTVLYVYKRIHYRHSAMW